MRHWISAIALGLFATCASAAPLAINLQLLHAAAPALHPSAVSALAVQSFLHLQTPPVLGQPVSLTPAAPSVPGLAELDFGNAALMVGGTMSMPGGSTPMALIDFAKGSFLQNGWIKLTISGSAGKHYAIDCRAGSAPVPVQYQFSGAISATGSVEVGADKHFVLATQALPANGDFFLVLTQPPPNFLAFYGCEISPF